MDLAARLRKLVNKEGYLPPWRLLALRIIDPVEWYMRKHDPESVRRQRRRRAHSPVGWTYSPLERPATEGGAPAAAGPAARSAGPPRPEPREGAEAYRQRLDTVRAEFGPRLEAKSRELHSGKPVTIETTVGTVRAKLVRFRNGAVYEDERRSETEIGRGMSRIERRELLDPLPLIEEYLIRSVLSLGADAHPLE